MPKIKFYLSLSKEDTKIKQHLYSHTIWKHVAAFADIFDDMEVYVYDDARKNVVGRKEVPVILAPKEKVVSVLSVIDGTPKPEIDNVLPKISIIWTGINWDSNRQTGIKEKRKLAVEFDDDTGQRKKSYVDRQTVPFLFDMQVTLWTAYMDEAVQLLENILPFFAPDLHITVYERTTGQGRKSKVSLESVTPNFVYELNEPDRRIIQFDLNFTMEVNLYTPIHFEKQIEKAYITVAAVDANNPNENEGDLIYTTTNGVSGQINDKDISSVIIAFDEIENTYTNEDIQNAIDDLNVLKMEAIEALPTNHTEEDVKAITDIYDDSIRVLGYDSAAWPYNALQYRQSLIDSIDYNRTAHINDNGLLDPSFPKYYESGYQAAFDALNDDQQVEAYNVKQRYDIHMNALINSNTTNEYVDQLLQDAEYPPLTPGIKERSAENNYKIERLG